MFKKKNNAYVCNPSLVERLIFWAMADMTLAGKKPTQLTFEQCESKWYMYTDIKSLLKDARCQDMDGFLAAVMPEIEQVRTAIGNLSKKVRDESILFLDADGNSFPRFVSYDNPSSDAD
jgi:hypothetical protein